MNDEQLKRGISLSNEIKTIKEAISNLRFIKSQPYHKNYTIFRIGYDNVKIALDEEDFSIYKQTVLIFYNQLEIDLIRRLSKLEVDYRNI